MRKRRAMWLALVMLAFPALAFGHGAEESEDQYQVFDIPFGTPLEEAKVEFEKEFGVSLEETKPYETRLTATQSVELYGLPARVILAFKDGENMSEVNMTFHSYDDWFLHRSETDELTRFNENIDEAVGQLQALLDAFMDKHGMMTGGTLNVWKSDIEQDIYNYPLVNGVIDFAFLKSILRSGKQFALFSYWGDILLKTGISVEIPSSYNALYMLSTTAGLVQRKNAYQPKVGFEEANGDYPLEEAGPE